MSLVLVLPLWLVMMLLPLHLALRVLVLTLRIAFVIAFGGVRLAWKLTRRSRNGCDERGGRA